MIIGKEKYQRAKKLIDNLVMAYEQGKPEAKQTQAEKGALRRLKLMSNAFQREVDSSETDCTKENYELITLEFQRIIDTEKDAWGPFKTAPDICTSDIPYLQRALRTLLAETDDNAHTAGAQASAQDMEAKMREMLAASEAKQAQALEQTRAESAAAVEQQLRALEERGKEQIDRLQRASAVVAQIPLEKLLALVGAEDAQILCSSLQIEAAPLQDYQSEKVMLLPAEYNIGMVPEFADGEAKLSWLAEDPENQISYDKTKVKDCVTNNVFAALWKLVDVRNEFLPSNGRGRNSQQQFNGDSAKQQVQFCEQLIEGFIYQTLVEEKEYSKETWSEKVDGLISQYSQIEANACDRLKHILGQIKAFQYGDELKSDYDLQQRFQVFHGVVSDANWLPKKEDMLRDLGIERNPLYSNKQETTPA